MYEDKTLVCKDCGNEFVFTAGEQEFYAERGFTNEPKRCKACRDAKRGGAPRRVPFQPREGRPIYCSACYAKMKEEA
jgi:CxxC-x17-CxxC domain-containing protein